MEAEFRRCHLEHGMTGMNPVRSAELAARDSWVRSDSLLTHCCCCARPADTPTQVLSLEDSATGAPWAFGDRLGLYAMCHLTAVTTTAVVSPRREVPGGELGHRAPKAELGLCRGRALCG